MVKNIHNYVQIFNEENTLGLLEVITFKWGFIRLTSVLRIYRGGKERKGEDAEEIDKMIFHFGETLIKLAKTSKETLKNEILFCSKGETGMTGVPWQKIMTNTYFTDLVAADAILSYTDCHVFLA